MKKCYKTAKDSQRDSYFGQKIDFNDFHYILLRKNSSHKNVVNFLTIYMQNFSEITKYLENRDFEKNTKI